MRICVGVMAYNEGVNVESSLRSVLGQEGAHLSELTVVMVASGCTDDTVPRARALASGESRLRIVEQGRREGKASAISALLAEAAAPDVVVLAGADTVLEDGALEALVAPFDDPTVGMTGGRPVPVNDNGTWMGRVVHVLWDLHHTVALERPKLGELVAFRPLFASLSSTAVDEAAIESIVRSRGLRLVYTPEARVRMKGPCTVSEFLTQRRRIYAGHLHLSRTRGYRVSTLSALRLVGTAWRAGPRGVTGRTALAGAAALEAAARALGAWDECIAGRRHEVWESLPSTKDLSS